MQQSLYVGIFLVTFLGISALSLRKGKTLKSSTDFSLAGRSLSAFGVFWVIIGTLVGGASTIGTVQMAYSHGIIAWIFTLGSGLACLLLGLLFSRPLRQGEAVTVSEYLGRFFGEKFQLYCSLFTSIGMFVHVVAQFLAAAAILQAVLGLSLHASVTVSFLLIAGFVVAGGMAGAGVVGQIKFYFLYLIMAVSAILAVVKAGGIGGIINALPRDAGLLNPFAGGVSKPLTDTLAMVVGVISTQSYLQAIFSARDIRAARNGALLSAALIPPVGILGIIIGLYLRATAPEIGANSALALPAFINQAFPPAVAAVLSAGLLLIVLGTGSGLVLGVTTNMYVDFVQKLRIAKGLGSGLAQIRWCGLLVLVLALGLVFTGLDSAILRWSYLSMGLRGSAVFAGLCLAVFFSGRFRLGRLAPGLYSLPVIYVLVVAWLKAGT